jgi:hypothetical protein
MARTPGPLSRGMPIPLWGYSRVSGLYVACAELSGTQGAYAIRAGRHGCIRSRERDLAMIRGRDRGLFPLLSRGCLLLVSVVL